MLRTAIHLALHVAVPLAAAWLVWRARWRAAAAVMLATMAIDLDHLLATPVFDPQRCSIGFHPLHRLPLAAAYPLLLVHPLTRWLGAGLCIHLALDALDCALMRLG
jgi:hypothetical protein